MAVAALSIAVSGTAAATTRMRNSAHNVANVLTENFTSHRTHLTAQRGGGVRASTAPSAAPGNVNLAREFMEQSLAGLSFRASARALDADLETKGSLLDMLA